MTASAFLFNCCESTMEPIKSNDCLTQISESLIRAHSAPASMDVHVSNATFHYEISLTQDHWRDIENFVVIECQNKRQRLEIAEAIFHYLTFNDRDELSLARACQKVSMDNLIAR